MLWGIQHLRAVRTRTFTVCLIETLPGPYSLLGSSLSTPCATVPEAPCVKRVIAPSFFPSNNWEVKYKGSTLEIAPIWRLWLTDVPYYHVPPSLHSAKTTVTVLLLSQELSLPPFLLPPP